MVAESVEGGMGAAFARMLAFWERGKEEGLGTVEAGRVTVERAVDVLGIGDRYGDGKLAFYPYHSNGATVGNGAIYA